MSEHVFYSAGQTEALSYGVKYLQQSGCVFSSKPDKNVTALLLDTPCRNPEQLPQLLAQLPKDITVVGGKLGILELQGYQTVDLLEDPLYLAENADITAHGAIKLALGLLPVTLRDLPVLVIGWGRIGKCLARLLQQLGCQVTVAARKETDRAMLIALGYNGVELSANRPVCAGYRVIFNTVPAQVLTQKQLQQYPAECLKIELASQPGLVGEDIINGRALPNRCAPESSGQLIARSILRLCC